tara:strand:+ start:377 stop:547 length:171 start_codon:yes stop_codon:yes gene_type:complete
MSNRNKVTAIIEKIADDCDINTMTREQMVDAQETVEFDIGYVAGMTRAIEIMEGKK